LIIAADGGIHPCVFANLPDLATGRKRKCFGSLGREGLDKTWWSNEYRQFRASFTTKQVDALCRDCPKYTGYN
jgi:radical SAM protein with 4Fe4S-binding SPASM domain